MKTLFRPALIFKHTHVSLPAHHAAVRNFNELLRETRKEHYVCKHRAYERAQQLVSINNMADSCLAGFTEVGSLDY
jgi:hypothetical protein